MSDDCCDVVKRWKYLQFIKSEGSTDGWTLDYSDELSGMSRDLLLSAAEVNFKINRLEISSLVFNAISSDPQLIECSDGLHEVWETVGYSTVAWRIFPVLFDRKTWKQMSHYVRNRRRLEIGISARDFVWMNKRQLQQTKVLMAESLGVADTSAIDRLLVYHEEEKCA